MFDKLNIGIIGCGHVSEHNHIPVILGTDQINIKWIYDSNISQLNLISKIFKLQKTQEINSSGINSLLIAIPVMNRSECNNFLIENKIAALIEKPAFKDYEEFLKIKNKIKERKIITHYGYNRRFYSNINYLKKIINSKVFGEIKSIKISEGSMPSRLGRNENWYLQDASQSGGGILIETGSHNIDTLSYIFNPQKLKLIKYKENYTYNNIEVDIESEGLLIFENKTDLKFEIKLSYINNLENKIIIEFDDIKLVMENIFCGKIFLEKDNFKLQCFDIKYDQDVDLIFKKQLLYFKNLVLNNDFEKSYESLNTTGLTTSFIDQCYKNK